MKRIILMILRLFYRLPGWLYKLNKMAADENDEIYSQKDRYEFLQGVTKKVNKAGRVKIEVHGLENLPKEDGFVLFPNHQGLFDALVFFESLGRPFSIVMKKEVENTPLVKQVRQAIHAKLMDREDVRQSMRVIHDISKEVKDGRNYIIFAEGTRSRKGNELLEFKGGAFKSAMSVQKPIVPAALVDSFKAFDTHSIEALTVKVIYLKPLYYDDYKDLKSQQVARIVEDRIREAIKEVQ